MTRRATFRHSDIDAAGCVLALLIGAGVFWWGVWPVLYAEDEAQRLASQMTNSQRQLEATQDQYRQLREQLAGTRQQLAELEIELDAPGELSTRQGELGRVFGELGMEVDQLSVGTIEHGPLLDIIPLRLTGRGTFPSLVKTMHQLREVFPDMAVTTFQVGGAGGAGGTEVSFSIGIAWYVARADASRG